MKGKPQTRRGLGKGLSALMAEVDLLPGQETTARDTLPIEQIIPNPDQPRRQFDPAQLEELADSIRHKGVLQPLIVRPHPTDEGLYQIVAGERRWRASQLARLHELPVLIRDLGDQDVMEIAIIENIQREDLNAIEEAASFRQLMDRFGHTQERLAEGLNKSRSHIANQLRLLTLPDALQDMVVQGSLTGGHARALVTAKEPMELAKKIVARKLSVRQTEDLVRRQHNPAPKRAATPKSFEDADTRVLAGDLSAQIDMPVKIKHNGDQGGDVVIKYKDLDQLEKLCQLLNS